MDIMRFADAPCYTGAGHDEVVARRLQGDNATAANFVWVGHSSFADGAIVPMDTGSIGKVSVVTEGALTIEQGDGVQHVLRTGDSIFVPAAEPRAVLNESGASAAIIVITPPPT